VFIKFIGVIRYMLNRNCKTAHPEDLSQGSDQAILQHADDKRKSSQKAKTAKENRKWYRGIMERGRKGHFFVVESFILHDATHSIFCHGPDGVARTGALRGT
jgi:hypothetical protein